MTRLNADEVTRSVTVRIPSSLHDSLKAEAARRGATFTQVVTERLTMTPANASPTKSSLTSPGKARPVEDPKDHMECRRKVVVGRDFCLTHQVFLS